MMPENIHRPVLIVIAGPNIKIISRYQKSIVNCIAALPLADRTYIYDNSVEDREARLLFRATDGRLTKQYTDAMPSWALPIYEALANGHLPMR